MKAGATRTGFFLDELINCCLAVQAPPAAEPPSAPAFKRGLSKIFDF